MSYFRPITPVIGEQYGVGSGINSQQSNDNDIPNYSSSSSSSNEDLDGQGQYHTGSDVGSDADAALPAVSFKPQVRLFDQIPRQFVPNLSIDPGAVGNLQRGNSIPLAHNNHRMMDFDDLCDTDKDLLAMMDTDLNFGRPETEGFAPPRVSRLDQDTSLVDQLRLGEKSLTEIDEIEKNLLYTVLRKNLIEVQEALTQDMEAEYEADQFETLQSNPYSRYTTRVYRSELLILERSIDRLFESLDKAAREGEEKERKSQRASPLGHFKHISLSSSPLDTTRLSPLSFGSAMTGRSVTPDWLHSQSAGESPAPSRHSLSKSSSSNSIDSTSFTPAPLRTKTMTASRSADSASSITLPSIQVMHAIDHNNAAQIKLASDMNDSNSSNSNNNNGSAEKFSDSLKQKLTKALDRYVAWIKQDYSVDICICHRFHTCHHNPLDDTSHCITQARVAAYEAYSQVKACREERDRRRQQLQPPARRSPLFFYTTNQVQVSSDTEREMAAMEQDAHEYAREESKGSVPFMLNKTESDV